MLLLALDLGDRRTGVATGDDVTGVVTPLRVIEAVPGPPLLDALAPIVEAHAPDAIVLGLPLNMDGTEGEPAKRARAFAAALVERCGRPVHLQDERLTSFAAEEHLAGSGRTRGQKKKLRDALAAAEILRDYLLAQR
ncbi:MAG: Holliday junction resolvase RuvX [Planctomycetota bacterium]|jgi:putative Holliday junction resolvase